ncbi:hypothetical protein [Staphylococcus succinus]|uniref:hypothetical protein n=1 Tax=Staphylococcus succinus TaxID=61015 RepID=UPI000E694B0F|nr:hypothetical protein [Staphylococcus succinus]RIN23979.1 hypothetical protein BU067_10880 [Staphylococcus succinus]
MMKAKAESEIRDRIATLYFQKRFNRLVITKAKSERLLKSAMNNRNRIEIEIRALKQSHGHYIKMFKKIQGKGSAAYYNYKMFGEVTT